MFTITMADISSTAGNSSDGIVRGEIDQSLFTTVYDATAIIEPVHALNLDVSDGSVDFTDYTTECTSGVPNSFLPWGTDVTFSAGDAVFLASDVPYTQVRMVIDTGAVWIGGGLEVWDSTDGVTANRQLIVTTDSTNGFRDTGTHIIEWADPGAPPVAWSPVPGLIAFRRWVVIKPAAFVSATTSPKASMTFLLSSTDNFMDRTTVFNEAMSDGSFGTVSDVVYMPGVSTIFSLPYPGPGLDLMVHRKIPDVRDVVLEYYSVGGMWVALPGLDDPSNWMKNGPAALTDPPQLFHVRWVPPLDWQVLPLPIQVYGGSIVTVTGAHIRARVTTVSDIAPQHPPLARARARSLNAAGGVRHDAGFNYTSLTFEAGIPASSDAVVQFLNINTGLAATATIPRYTRSSCNLPAQKVLLSQALLINSGDALLITWQSGGSLQNVEFVLQ